MRPSAEPPPTLPSGDAPVAHGLAGWAERHVTSIGVFTEPAATAASQLVLRTGRCALPSDVAVRHDWAGGRIDLSIAGGGHQARVVLAGSGAELVETVAATDLVTAASAATGAAPSTQGPTGPLPRDVERIRGGERWRFAASILTLDSRAFEQAVADMHAELDVASRAVAVTYMAPPGLGVPVSWAGTISALACTPTEQGIAWRGWVILPATGEVVITTSELLRVA